MVVEVLMTNCHVSLKWKYGPSTAQTSTVSTAAMKVVGLPVRLESLRENTRNHDVVLSNISSSNGCQRNGSRRSGAYLMIVGQPARRPALLYFHAAALRLTERGCEFCSSALFDRSTP